ncbi:MAG: alpha-N-acetylglucosaminidase TIM-barrel domain-containing protein [Coriobacteriaceae bacterium]|nr:alpha-N-acetylglucosaminidase TIM-barrel domain-containing protein [Coriobacteriaceae bacterium]
MAQTHRPARCLCKRAIVGVGAALSAVALAPTIAWGADAAIAGLTATGASAPDHAPALAVDGDPKTYWESPGVNSMQDYRRFIDIDLHGLFRVSKIDLTLREGSYYHYGLYVSADGETYNKVAFKTNDDVATASAASHTFDPVEARYVRVAINFNSAAQAVNVAEVSVFGEKVSSDPAPATPIEVEDFANTTWGTEWERVESDAAYAAEKTIAEVNNLVGRVLGKEYQDWFVFELRDARDGKDVFEISDNGDGRIKVRGNNGVSLASGLNYYLRHFCKVDYNPLFGSNLEMPAKAPEVGKKLLKYTDYEYRYALNFCTYSYTMAFWDWGEYEPFLDWCAMNGVNLLLDIVGQEEVLRQTLTQYGYTDEEVKEYITGPAYYAWFYMQNMTSAGGPLPDSWFEQRTELARQIHDRMQAYGIKPVIQGFGGQVPADFAEKNPTAVAASSGSWSGYDRPFMIKTFLTEEDKAQGKEDFFDRVGTTFYETQERLFGDVSNYYAVDPFHEGGTLPPGFNIVDIYRTVQQKMLSHDKDAVWVMQQWQWGINNEKLSGLANKDQALVLDLQSDLRSQASPMEEVGVPWVWNMLHNFGGRMGMDGVPEVLANDITEAYNSNKYMRGIGITPEAIDNSPIVYELLFDMTWEQDPVDYRAWTHDYVERRYGGTDPKIEEAWDILLDTAYKHKDGEYYQGASESIINARPSDSKIGSASTWGHSDIDYDKEEFERAAQLFIESYDTYKDCEAFRYDFVDVMRQVLQNTFQEYQPLAGAAYKSGNLELFQKLSDQMLKIVDMQDKLLATSEHFLLGTWIEDARTMLEGADDWTADLFELNARALVSTWGQEKNSSLVDYSNRQWAGLTGDYYKGRWEIYATNRIEALKNGTQASDPSWFTYGWEWANLKSDESGAYATKVSKDDPKALATQIMDKFTIGAMSEFTDGGVSIERVNLAAGKDVKDVDANTTVPNLTDGNTDTGWKEPGKKNATLEVDLGGTFDISGIGLTLQQIAADFPLSYTMKVLDEQGQWVEVGKSTGDKVSSKNEVECKVRGSKVRFELASTDGNNLTGIYEVSVLGTALPAGEFTNLSLGATASASSTEGIRDVSWGIDGKEDTLWVNNGSGAAWYKVDLASAQRVDRVRLVFEQPGRQFKFRVVAGMADGSERELLDMTNPTAALERIYTMDLGAEVKWVKVEFTDATGSAWPAIAELELLQEKSEGVAVENIASSAKITSSAAKPGEGVDQLTDGSATGEGDCWVSKDGAKPAHIQLDFPTVKDVESMRLLFEQDTPDRSMQFTVKAIMEDGSMPVVYERGADKLGEQQGLEIDIPVNKAVKGLRIDIQDAKVPSNGSGAWPLVGEIEVFARPGNIALGSQVSAGEGSSLDAAALGKLVDGDTAGEVVLASEADKTITLALDRAVDVEALMLSSAMGSTPLKFTVEYLPEGVENAEYKTLVDCKDNAAAKSSLFVRAAKPALTRNVRVTFHSEGEVKLTEIALYAADVSAPLRDQLDQARAVLAGVKVGEHAGCYTQAAVDALDTVLDGAEAALEAGVNSQDVAEWQAKIADALRVFYRDGFVTVNRSDLYVALEDAKATSKALREQGENAAADALDAAYAEANKVADTYKVTQAELDAAAEKLSAAIDAALAQLDAATRLQVLIDSVDELLKQAEVGEFEGQYPQAAADALVKARDAAVQAKADAAGNVDKLAAAEKALADAKDAFLKSAVHIDAAAYEAALQRAEGYAEKNHDRDAWKAFEKALSQAQDVDLAQVSQANLDALTGKLEGAMDELDKQVLDRSELEAAIARAQAEKEGDYTAESWKPFKKALDAALKALDASSTTQAELDAAADALAKAQEELVAKDHGGDQGGDGDTDGDSGNQGGNQGDGSDGNGQQGGGQTGQNGQAGGSNNQDGLPSTGDPASLVGVFGVMAGASVLGGFSWRKRKERTAE